MMNRMKKTRYGAVFMLLLASAGCTSAVPEPPAVQKPVVLKKADFSGLRPRCEHFVQAMTRSLQSGNFAEWHKALEAEGTPGKPLAVNEQKFRLLYKNLQLSHGTLVQSRYLGELDQDVCRDFLWVFSFRSADGTPKEELFVIRCAAFSGTPAIAGFGFRFFNSPKIKSPKK